jgi:hypothetical protein
MMGLGVAHFLNGGWINNLAVGTVTQEPLFSSSFILLSSPRVGSIHDIS